MNQYDAEQARALFDRAGWQEAGPGEGADVVLVHTCAVTANALRKSRQAVRRAHREGAKPCVIMSGCACALPDTAPPDEVSVCIRPGPGWLTRLEEVMRQVDRSLDGFLAAENADTFSIDRFSAHTRAFLKIQDGCDMRCAYCIVPSLRGASRSRPLETVVAEAGALAASGHVEVVVSGVSVGLYGMKDNGSRLADVMRELAHVPGIERLRLSSLHPRELTDDLLEVWAREKKIMPHVHLPLQSGSDAILKAMRRGYTADDFMEALERVREKLDRPAFTTDIIVGFPGETDDDFKATRAMVERVGFSRTHIFPYSPRPGTPAAALADRVPRKTAAERAQVLKEAAAQAARAYHLQFEGSSARVLVETHDPEQGTCAGYTERYIPVQFKAPKTLQGSIVDVKLTETHAGGMKGKLEKKTED